MGTNVMEKEKILSLAQAQQYLQLQEGLAVREKKLSVELEIKQDLLLKQMEASFAAREKKLIDDMKAEHGKLYEAAIERERVLRAKLISSRQQLALVVVLALLSIAVILNYKTTRKDTVKPVAQAASVSAETLSLAPTTSEVVVIAPAPSAVIAAPVAVTAPEVVVKPVKTGNGGNFSSGRSSQK
jgi:hypothetical protein